MTAHPGRRAHWSPLAGLLACAIPLLPSALEAQTSQLIWENEYADGATATPVTIGGTTVSIAGLDPLGIGVGGNFTVQHATWGGHAGYWESGVDATSQAQSLTFRLTFSQPVESLSFSLLDIDTNGSFHDSITVVGWESTTPFSPTTVFLGPAVISPAPGIYAGQANVETTSTDGNVDLRFDQPVDSVTFEYGPGPRAATDPALQVMGLSDLTWTIPCGPPPTVSTTAELRAAVADSCASLILLNPGTYDLTASGSGELFIDQGKTLRNAGGGEVIIDAAGASRAIRITTGNTVELDGLTITGGNSGGANGGGILTDGDLTIRNSTITGNSTGVDGAGLYMATGSLLMENVTVSGNTATSDGGGLDVTDATQLIHVTVANNSAGNQGGGIRSRNAAVQLVNSLVGDNVSGSGGQIANQITSLGINLAEGGCLGCRAIDLTGDPLLLPLALNGGDSRTHALDGPSIARDTADAAFGLPTDQRGVSRPVASGYDIGAFEASPAPFGISVDPDALAIQRSTGSQQTQDFDVVNESTTTESVTLTGSVGPAGSSFLTVDSLTGPGVAGAGASASVTIGSGATATVTVWYTVATAPVGTVDTLRLTGDITVDPRYTDDGWAEIEWVCAPTTSVTTTAELRAAVADPCVSTILLTPGLYDLTASGSGELFIDQDKTLRNAGGGEVIIDAAGASRVIRAEPGNVIELDGLTITGGVSGADGGGIWADANPLTIRNSTITGNSTTGHGGGLFMNGGGLLLENVTISGNTASGNGGGLDIRTNAQLVHVTVANNTADEGGGLDPRNNTVQLVNSIVADNTSTGGGGQIRRELTSVGINLVEDGCVGCRAIDLTGDPLLLPLALNGGDSRTHALDGPSIARDTADVAFALATDQRGVPRPVAFGYDLGAYEADQAPYGIKLSPKGGLVQRESGTEYQQDFDVVNRSMTAEDIDLTGTVQPVGSFLTIDSITGTGVIGSGATATVNVASLATTTITTWYSVSVPTGGTVDTLRLAGSITADPSYADDGWVDVEWICSPTQTVTTTAQLRAAVADPCVGLILLTPGTYDLTASGSGELFIDQDKTLRNAGGGEVIIDAAGASRVIRAEPGNVIELDGLRITGGVSGNDGGGIRADADPLTIRNSTITGNSSTGGHGGGLFMNGGGLLLENVTISGNTASGNGGGLDIRTNAQLVHVTVANNTADEGGGLDPRNNTVQLVNSIVADNISTGGGGQIRREITSLGINLVEDGCVGCRAIDLTGDPLLLPLALNGGDSRTHALDGPSIARDTADVAFALATDQRGVSRPVAFGYDLGAYEAAQAPYGIKLSPNGLAIQRGPGTEYQQDFDVVNRSMTAEDIDLTGTVQPVGSFLTIDSITGTGVIGSGATATVNVASLATTTITAWFSAVTAPLGQIDTLRLAGEIVSDPRYTDDGWVEVEQVCTPTSSVSTTAQLRNAVTDGCVGLILLTPGTYDLTVSGTGELFIDQNKTLRNAGGGEVIIDAAGASRVIHIDQNDVTVELDGLTITGGVSGADGGGVRTDGNNGTSVTIRNSTITGNATTGHGGGLFMNGGGLLLENVTVSGNTASGNGGGLDVRTTAQLVHVTVANNTADEGGGLDPRNSTVQLVNSIVADNTSTGGGGQIRRELTSVGINLVEGGCVGCLPSDLTGDPLLLPLALNGGDSRTHALDGPSIARDTADVAFALATDQRGVSRPQGVGYDLGAYEAELSISATMVAAASAANRLPSNGTGYQESFTLTNSGAGSSAFTLRATAAGSAVVVDSIRGPGLTFGAQPDSALTATLAGNGGSVAVAVFYTVPDISAGTTDTLILTATSVVSPMLSVTDSTTVTVVRPSLSLGKTATVTGDTIPGADVTYQITVTNLGTEAAVQVVVRDSIPVEVDYRLGSTSETLPPGVTAVVEFDDGTDTWTYAPVSEGCGAPVGYDGCVRYTRWPLDNPLPQTAPDNVAVFSFVARIR